MLSPILIFLLMLPILVIAALAVFVGYLVVKYTPIIGRVFEDSPMFLPLRLAPRSEGEEVRFTTSDGLALAGTYLPARSPSRAGVLVFCHEFLSDRWSYQPYADALRDLGFDIFSFDFRNHGSSASDRVYQPLQWVTDHEVNDLRAALGYLRSRGDRDPAGFGLLGISRGGGTALVVAAEQVDVWGIITDGAFPTRGTMLTYILRWAQIFVHSAFVYAILRDYTPRNVFSLLSLLARRRAERRLSCKFPDIEGAVARLSPRPWLMVHGGKDAYIGPAIARGLFDEGREPKELWIVPGAKHNRCREVDPDAYAARIEAFLSRSAPRRLAVTEEHAGSDSPGAPGQGQGQAKTVETENGAPIEHVSMAAPTPSHSSSVAASVSS